MKLGRGERSWLPGSLRGVPLPAQVSLVAPQPCRCPARVLAGHILCNPAGNLTSAGSGPRSVCLSASSGEQPRRCPVRGDFRADLTRADVGVSPRADRVREASTARLGASPAPPPQAASWQDLGWGWGGGGVTPVPIPGSGGRGVKGPTGRKCTETANARSPFEQLWSQGLRRPVAGTGSGGSRGEPKGQSWGPRSGPLDPRK